MSYLQAWPDSKICSALTIVPWAFLNTGRVYSHESLRKSASERQRAGAYTFSTVSGPRRCRHLQIIAVCVCFLTLLALLASQRMLKDANSCQRTNGRMPRRTFQLLVEAFFKPQRAQQNTKGAPAASIASGHIKDKIAMEELFRKLKTDEIAGCWGVTGQKQSPLFCCFRCCRAFVGLLGRGHSSMKMH